MNEMAVNFTEDEIKAEVRRLRAAAKREQYRRNPEAQRAATERWWRKKALASLSEKAGRAG